MRIVFRGLLPTLALAVAVSVVLSASTSSSARSELQLELGDLLVEDERYWEAIRVFTRAKEGGTAEQIERASAGLLQALLVVAEFNQAFKEALFLHGLHPEDPERRALYGDGLWSYGLFEEAEAVYQDILAESPSSAGARHGFARSLAAQGRLDDALNEIRTALAASPERAEFYHTLGSIQRRMKRFGDAADSFDEFVGRLHPSRRVAKADWARSQARFLRSFGDREPVDIQGPEYVVHTVPFTLDGDKVVVQAYINEEGPYDLVVDTGAEQMVLSQETAQEVGVRPLVTTISAGVGDVGVRGLDLGRADSLRIGTLEVSNLPAIIKNPPLTGLPESRVKDSMSPLAFGLSTKIDYRNKSLVMATRLPYEPADIELPMRVHRLAVVRGVVNGEHPKSFVVDTGGEVISISLGTANAIDTVPPRRIPLRVFGTSGWDADAFLLPGVKLAFSEIEYDNFSVVVLNLHRPSALLGFHIGGIIGHRFLSEYVVSIDMQRSMLRLNRY